MEFKNGYKLLYQKKGPIYASKTGKPEADDLPIEVELTEEEIKKIKLVYETKDGLAVSFTGIPSADDPHISILIDGEEVIGVPGKDGSGNKRNRRTFDFFKDGYIIPTYTAFSRDDLIQAFSSFIAFLREHGVGEDKLAPVANPNERDLEAANEFFERSYLWFTPVQFDAILKEVIALFYSLDQDVQEEGIAIMVRDGVSGNALMDWAANRALPNLYKIPAQVAKAIANILCLFDDLSNSADSAKVTAELSRLVTTILYFCCYTGKLDSNTALLYTKNSFPGLEPSKELAPFATTEASASVLYVLDSLIFAINSIGDYDIRKADKEGRKDKLAKWGSFIVTLLNYMHGGDDKDAGGVTFEPRENGVYFYGFEDEDEGLVDTDEIAEILNIVGDLVELVSNAIYDEEFNKAMRAGMKAAMDSKHIPAYNPDEAEGDWQSKYYVRGVFDKLLTHFDVLDIISYILKHITAKDVADLWAFAYKLLPEYGADYKLIPFLFLKVAQLIIPSYKELRANTELLQSLAHMLSFVATCDPALALIDQIIDGIADLDLNNLTPDDLDEDQSWMEDLSDAEQKLMGLMVGYNPETGEKEPNGDKGAPYVALNYVMQFISMFNIWGDGDDDDKGDKKYYKIDVKSSKNLADNYCLESGDTVIVEGDKPTLVFRAVNGYQFFDCSVDDNPIDQQYYLENNTRLEIPFDQVWDDKSVYLDGGLVKVLTDLKINEGSENAILFDKVYDTNGNEIPKPISLEDTNYLILEIDYNGQVYENCKALVHNWEGDIGYTIDDSKGSELPFDIGVIWNDDPGKPNYIGFEDHSREHLGAIIRNSRFVFNKEI